MYIDINALFTFEVSKSDDQSILAAIVRPKILKTEKLPIIKNLFYACVNM
jgi:hypothetical protein